MSFFAFANDPTLAANRRNFLKSSSGLMLTGTAIALLSGREALAAGKAKGHDAEGDVRILNTALGAELEAIAAYQVGAESGLLQKPVLDLAVTFQGHHKAHADVLAKTVEKLGGKPVAAKAKYTFPVEKLKTQNDVLNFAASLEKGAVSAYLGAIPVFNDRDLAKAAGSILGDEAMHWAILRNAVGEPPGPGGVRIVMRFAGAVLLAAALAAGTALAAPKADAKKGEEIYSRCLACHALAYDRTGPRHCGLFGRKAGSRPGFAYSDAMKHSKITWNAKSLDRFIEDPMKAVPGTAMGYAGVKDAQERADLIAYLEAANKGAECKGVK